MNNNLLLFLVIITLFVALSTAWLDLVVININNNKVFAQTQNQNPNQNNTITTNTPCDFSFVAPNVIYPIKYAATNNNNTCSLQSYYQAGPLPDPYNDPTHIKAKQQFDNYTHTFNNWIYTKDCDKGSGHPLCYNVGYYYGVIEANNDNSYYGLHPSEKRYLYGCNWPFTANFCAGYAQAYSHTFAGHISNASEIWSEGYLAGYYSGKSLNPYSNTPLNGTNPASCTEGPPVFCDGYAQGYPHGIEYALGNELGTKAADNDWNLKGANPNATEIIPPCPPGHTTDWCDGFKTEYNEEWGRFTDIG